MRDSSIFDQFRATLKGGPIQVVAADQLFATPPDLAARMVDEADIKITDRILEPSAGTGAILRELPALCLNVIAVEINAQLVNGLRHKIGFERPRDIHHGDFLEVADTLGTFDKILMNPPFSHGQDIKHISKAASLLATGGTLVAICANGPRQNDQLRHRVVRTGGVWEPLPPGTFKDQGTNVNTVLLTIHN